MGYEDEQAFKDWESRVRTELIPMLESSSVNVSLVPTGETDVKFAVELGLSIMMDKPIIAVVSPGAKVPDKLVRVADHLIEGDLTTEVGHKRLQEKLGELLKDD